jgi:hypothetical protein
MIDSCPSFVGKDGAMPSKYDENAKARAVRLVREHRMLGRFTWAAGKWEEIDVGLAADCGAWL